MNTQQAMRGIFDTEDSDLAQLKWSLTRKGYLRKRWGGGEKKIMAHRVVLMRKLGRDLSAGEFCDHINGCRTDNRRCNLRVVSAQENSRNIHARSRAASGFRGVYWCVKARKWVAYVRVYGKRLYCGTHENVEEAARAASERRQQLGYVESAQ